MFSLLKYEVTSPQLALPQRVETAHFLLSPLLSNASICALSHGFQTDGEALEIHSGFSVARVCRGRLQAPSFSSDSLYF